MNDQTNPSPTPEAAEILRKVKAALNDPLALAQIAAVLDPDAVRRWELQEPLERAAALILQAGILCERMARDSLADVLPTLGKGVANYEWNLAAVGSIYFPKVEPDVLILSKVDGRDTLRPFLREHANMQGRNPKNPNRQAWVNTDTVLTNLRLWFIGRANLHNLARARENGESPCFQPSQEFMDCDLPDDIADDSALLAKLRGSRGAKLATHLWEQFGDDVKRLLATDNAAAEEVRAVLNEGLNTVLQSGSIYTVARFRGIRLSAQSEALLKGQGTKALVPRLNRLLLEDAFPKEIRRHQLRRWIDGVESFHGHLKLWTKENGDVHIPRGEMVGNYGRPEDAKKVNRKKGPIRAFQGFIEWYRMPKGEKERLGGTCSLSRDEVLLRVAQPAV